MAEDIDRECRDCGVAYTMEASEVAWFEGKGFELPKRCQDCRRKRREQREAEASGS